MGGKDADPQEWPWMAALMRDGASSYCGGVLITDSHILTAAHCVDGYEHLLCIRINVISSRIEASFIINIIGFITIMINTVLPLILIF